MKIHFLVAVSLFTVTSAWADSSVIRPYTTIEDVQGSTRARYSQLKFPNGSLEDHATFYVFVGTNVIPVYTSTADARMNALSLDTTTLSSTISNATGTLSISIYNSTNSFATGIANSTNSMRTEIASSTGAFATGIANSTNTMRSEIASSTGTFATGIANSTGSFAIGIANSTNTMRTEIASSTGAFATGIANSTNTMRTEIYTSTNQIYVALNSTNTAFNVFSGTSDAQQTKFVNFRSTGDSSLVSFVNFLSTAGVDNEKWKAFTSTSDSQQGRFVNFRTTSDAIFNSSSTWTGANTFTSSTTFNSISTLTVQGVFVVFSSANIMGVVSSTTGFIGNAGTFTLVNVSGVNFLSFTSTSDSQQTKFVNFRSTTDTTMTTVVNSTNSAFNVYSGTSDARGNTFVNFRSTTDTTMITIVNTTNSVFNVYSGTSDAQQTKFVNFRSTTDTNMVTFVNSTNTVFNVFSGTSDTKLQAAFTGVNSTNTALVLAVNSTFSALVTAINSTDTAFNVFSGTSDAQQTKFVNFRSTMDTTITTVVNSTNNAFNVFSGTSDAQQNRFVNFRTTSDAILNSSNTWTGGTVVHSSWSFDSASTVTIQGVVIATWTQVQYSTIVWTVNGSSRIQDNAAFQIIGDTYVASANAQLGFSTMVVILSSAPGPVQIVIGSSFTTVVGGAARAGDLLVKFNGNSQPKYSVWRSTGGGGIKAGSRTSVYTSSLNAVGIPLFGAGHSSATLSAIVNILTNQQGWPKAGTFEGVGVSTSLNGPVFTSGAFEWDMTNVAISSVSVSLIDNQGRIGGNFAPGSYMYEMGFKQNLNIR